MTDLHFRSATALARAGVRTTAGAPPLAQHVPPADATSIARLRGAGAVIPGKTNVPIFAGDLQSYNAILGTTSNPWDATRAPGRSSGGPAAAIAAGLAGLELGSDIGGSIRTPASWTGVFGHKPTYGLVPLQGHIPPMPGARAEFDLAVIGPLARGDGRAAARGGRHGRDGRAPVRLDRGDLHALRAALVLGARRRLPGGGGRADGAAPRRPPGRPERVRPDGPRRDAARATRPRCPRPARRCARASRSSSARTTCCSCRPSRCPRFRTTTAIRRTAEACS